MSSVLRPRLPETNSFQCSFGAARGSVPSLSVPGPFQIKTEAYLVWEEGIGCRWARKKRDPAVGSLLLERGAGGLWLMPEAGRKSEVLVLGQG